jgi:hypothetical protein
LIDNQIKRENRKQGNEEEGYLGTLKSRSRKKIESEKKGFRETRIFLGPRVAMGEKEKRGNPDNQIKRKTRKRGGRIPGNLKIAIAEKN